jgi:Holliday junction resolvase RusA-like endonuclease
LEKIASFIFTGRPLIQKNNIKIRRRKVNGKLIPFVGHSKEFTDYRDQLSMAFREQYEDQGHDSPIDYPIEVHFKFFVEKRSVGDVDNYPSASLDALQGIKTGRKKVDRDFQVLVDDKLVYKIVVERYIKGSKGYEGEPRLEFDVYKYEE